MLLDNLDLHELFTCYSKHMGGDEEDSPDEHIGRACEELIDIFEKAIELHDTREKQLAYFTHELKQAACYSGWRPRKRDNA